MDFLSAKQSLSADIEFQSSLPVRGATWSILRQGHTLGISIHAPREGSDKTSYPWATTAWYFNPRSPEGERRSGMPPIIPPPAFQSTLPGRGATVFANIGEQAIKFQSTLPGRGATRGGHGCRNGRYYFNPRSPGGERPAGVSFAVRKLAISIHAPREGSDELTYIRHLTAFISIHAPREGSDGAAPGDGGRRMDFNPRSP